MVARIPFQSHNQSRAGTYGTLYLNTTSGAYLYIPSDSVVEGTTSSQSEALHSLYPMYSLCKSDADGDHFRVNDTPILDHSLVFVTDTAADDTFSDVSNSLTTTERDSSDSLAYAISGGHRQFAEWLYPFAGWDLGTLYLNKSSGAINMFNAIDWKMLSRRASACRFQMQLLPRQTLTTTVNGVMMRQPLLRCRHHYYRYCQ